MRHRTLLPLLVLGALLQGFVLPTGVSAREGRVEFVVTSATVDIQSGAVTVTGYAVCDPMTQFQSDFSMALDVVQTFRRKTGSGFGAGSVTCDEVFTLTTETHEGARLKPGMATITVGAYFDTGTASPQLNWEQDVVEMRLKFGWIMRR